MKPRATGGANWPPSSYDPETTTLYVCAQDGMSAFSTSAEPQFVPPEPGERYVQGMFGRSEIAADGIFAALDVTTNRLRWRQRWSDICYSGSIVTAGGLVFVGRNDGRFIALDKRNGDVLWEHQTDAGINATASTFMHKGTQFVAVLAAGSFFPGTPHGDGLWIFSIDGDSAPNHVPPANADVGDSTLNH